MMQQVRLLINWQELQAFGYPGGPKVDKLAKEGQVNISSLGEVAIIPKQFFYDLLKAYTEINKI